MPWITPTLDDLQSRLTGAELGAFSTAALATGQGDPVAKIMASTVDEIRGRVAACSSNKLGPAGTIPPRLLDAFAVLVRYRVATRLPGMAALIDELRVREYDEALSTLRAVAACSFAIEDPAGDETSVGGSSPAFDTPPRFFTRRDEDGV